MCRLRMKQCLVSTDIHLNDLFHNIRELQCGVTNDSLNNIAVSKWNQCIDLAKEFKGQLSEFTRQESQKSKSFEYWSVFPNSIVPFLRDLTYSFREKDWSLHLSPVQWAIPLFFSNLIVQTMLAGRHCILTIA